MIFHDYLNRFEEETHENKTIKRETDLWLEMESSFR